MTTELTLRQLEYFAALAETRSVTAAAKSCHVSQGAVSLALGQLEEALGLSLVIRRPGKSLRLTAEGRMAAARARSVVEQVKTLRDEVTRAHDELAGRLNIGVFTTVAALVIPHLAHWFADRHPAVEVNFIEAPGPELREAADNGRTQLSIGYVAMFDDHSDVQVIHKFYRQVLLSPTHPLAAYESLSFGQLTDHPAALLSLEPALQRTLAEFHRYGVEPKVKWLFANVPAIHSLVGRGLAYSLLMQPTSASPEGLPLLMRPLSDPTEPNSLVAALPRGVWPSAMVQEAIRALKAQWR